MRHLLALDQGTSSSRAIVFREDGSIRALAQQEFTQHFPQPGWVEHDADEIWSSQLAVAHEALARAGLQPRDISAIGITNQRETAVLWDRRSGRPVHRAIVWQDRRGEPLCAQLRAQEGMSERIVNATGLRVDAYFSATKLRWLLDHVSGAHIAAAHGDLAFGTVDSWLVWQLTKGQAHVTDVSNASRTMLFDVRHNVWDRELLAALHVPESVLPKVFPSAHLFGHTHPDLFGAPIPIAGIAGDQQSALFGQACFAPGLAKNTYGTGCFLLMHVGERFRPSAHGLVVTSAAQPGATPEFALEGSVFVAGAVVQWLRDGLKCIEKSADVQALAASVPDSGGVTVVPAFTGLGAPYWDTEARGTITGLTRGSTAAHIARAAVESIAYQSAALLQAMQADAKAMGAPPLTELRVDGGASVNDALMQFQADLLGVPVVRPKVVETTALGAAYLAGLATGVYAGRDELAAQWQVERRFEPTMSRDEAVARLAGWEHAVRQARSR
jgi:glycerol kinase